MNIYYSIPISFQHSNTPKKNLELDPKLMVNVSLPMQLDALQIRIHFLTGFHALVSRPRYEDKQDPTQPNTGVTKFLHKPNKNTQAASCVAVNQS
jgi:hypothetical protein